MRHAILGTTLFFVLAVVSQRTNLAARARFDGQVG